MTKYPEITRALNAPFEPHEVKVRPQGGRQLSYITARTAMNRLDDVFGSENWEDSYFPIENGVVCTIKVTYPDGRVVSKSDAGGHAGMQDQGDDEKSGFSDAFKRAAIKFGVGRYLYRDGVPKVAQDQQEAPREAQQAPRTNQPPVQQQRSQQTQDGPRKHDGPPRSGRALFAWASEHEKHNGKGLIKYINDWAKSQGYRGRIVDWDQEQAVAAHAEALSAIQNMVGQTAESGPQSDDYDDRPY